MIKQTLPGNKVCSKKTPGPGFFRQSYCVRESTLGDSSAGPEIFDWSALSIASIKWFNSLTCFEFSDCVSAWVELSLDCA
ncbi:MAG: hypothetical protein ACRERS_06705, partial [Methylococcales bacterium]